MNIQGQPSAGPLLKIRFYAVDKGGYSKYKYYTEDFELVGDSAFYKKNVVVIDQYLLSLSSKVKEALINNSFENNSYATYSKKIRKYFFSEEEELTDRIDFLERVRDILLQNKPISFGQYVLLSHIILNRECLFFFKDSWYNNYPYLFFSGDLIEEVESKSVDFLSIMENADAFEIADRIPGSNRFSYRVIPPDISKKILNVIDSRRIITKYPIQGDYFIKMNTANTNNEIYLLAAYEI